MTTIAIPILQIPSTIPDERYNVWDSAISTVCRPLVFAYEKIREGHEYIESCSGFQKLALTILTGAALAAISFPLILTIGAIATQCISLAVGREKYDAISKEAPLYSGKTLSGLDVCIIAPVVEEVLFRGIIQPAAKELINFLIAPFCDTATAKKIAAIAAIVFTSLFFGAMHFINSPNLLISLPQVICASFTGIILGLEKEFGGGLLQTTAHHITNNTVVWVAIQTLKSTR